MPDYCDILRCARVDADRVLGSHSLDANDCMTYGALLVDEPGHARLGVDPRIGADAPLPPMAVASSRT